jgi:hypothetical protein
LAKADDQLSGQGQDQGCKIQNKIQEPCKPTNRILHGTPFLPALRKVLVSIYNPSIPLHGEDQRKHVKCLLDQVIAFFSERLEVPADRVEAPGTAPGYMNWIWEAGRVEESYAPHSRPSTGLHAPFPKLLLIYSSED